MARSCLAALCRCLALVLIAAGATGCADDVTAPRGTSPQSFHDGVSPAESLSMAPSKAYLLGMRQIPYSAASSSIEPDHILCVTWTIPVGLIRRYDASVCATTYQAPEGALWDPRNNGYVGPITYVFSQPVNSKVAVLAGGGDCRTAWGAVTAFAGSAVVGSGVPPIVNPDDCGPDQVTHSSYVTFGPGLQITKIVVEPNELMAWPLPNAPDLMAYREGQAMIVEFVEPCFPLTGIAMLDQEEWRFAMDSLLRASNVYQRPPLTEREEKSGRIWMNKVTGIHSYEPVFEVLGEPCSTPGPSPPARVIGNDTLVAVYHSHPVYRGEDLRAVCDNPHLGPYDPDRNGGGSDNDWANADNWGNDLQGIDAIVVTPERVHLLKRRTPKHLRPLNPNAWTVTPDRCLKS